jgi:hypothetical protein
MSLIARAKSYTLRMPGAVSGERGHQATFNVAVALIHGFGLSENEAWPIICEHNSKCSPPWSEAELRHKLESAGKLSRHPYPRGYLASLSLGISHRNAVGISRPLIQVVKLAPLASEMEPTEQRAKRESSPVKSGSPDEESGEAKRIAGELVKLHRARAFAGANDPEAPFYAALLHTFGGSYEGRLGHNVSDTRPSQQTPES